MCIAGCSSPTQAMIQALRAEKTRLDGITANGSGKSLGEVAAAFTMLKDVSHRLSVLETGTGLYKGNRSGDTSSATATDCTIYVLEVLKDAFTQHGRAKEWEAINKKSGENKKLRGENTLSGIDLQAALQAGQKWAGLFWAPDPTYKSYTWKSVKSDEQSYAYHVAKKQGTYYKGFVKDYPGISIDKLVIDYAPEQGSSTVKNTKELVRLKRLPFGVLSAHGGYHMCLIVSGVVYEVHWSESSKSLRLMEATLLESWGGLGRWGSGAIVAPRADVDKAWET